MILSPDFRERAHILEKYLFIVKINLITLYLWDFLPYIKLARDIPACYCFISAWNTTWMTSLNDGITQVHFNVEVQFDSQKMQLRHPNRCPLITSFTVFSYYSWIFWALPFGLKHWSRHLHGLRIYIYQEDWLLNYSSQTANPIMNGCLPMPMPLPWPHVWEFCSM